MRTRSPAMANIQRRAISLIRCSISENSANAYSTAINCFNSFRAVYSLPNDWPAPLNQLILFIAYCFEKNYAPSTVILYMSGISFVHKIKGFYNPSENFVIRKMLEGCKRLRHRKDYRAPISMTILKKIIATLKHICYSDYETVLFTAAFYLAYFGLFRVSELVICSNKAKGRALTKENVIFDRKDNSVIICIRVSKTNQAGRPVFVRIPSNDESKVCIESLKKYTSIRSLRSEQFFCHSNGLPLTRYQFSTILSKACRHAGLSSNHLTHSFRIGRATDLALQGFSGDKIKQMGRWASNTYTCYIRPRQ